MRKHFILALCCVALASCSRLTPGAPLPNGVSNSVADLQSKSQGTYRLLYSFDGNTGRNPEAGLIGRNAYLFGTAFKGAEYDVGTVFETSPEGNVNVLYAFDGASPAGDLVFANGLFYGTTIHGGDVGSGYGTVFEMDPAGDVTVLHGFGLADDGAFPFAGLVEFHGRHLPPRSMRA